MQRETLRQTAKALNKAAVLGSGVFPRLLLPDERIFVFGLGFKDDERETLFIKEKEIDKPLARLLEVFPKPV